MNHHLKPTLIAVLIGLTVLLLSACSQFGGEATPTPFVDDGEEDPFIGVPNPAYFYCEEMGYQVELREAENGDTEGFCIFPNGAECGLWEFLAGGCSIEWTFCQRQGYNISAGEEMGTCTFPDGSTCPEYEFFIEECQSPEN